MRITRRTFSGGAAALLASSAMPAFAQEKVYNVALLSDFSGPFANIMKPVAAGRDSIYAWWNDEVGKGLGVRIGTRTYDTRYDAAQVASLWPAIISDLNPLVINGVGTPDVAALSERLPEQKVVMFTLGGATHAGWKDDSWVFFPRATYAHEFAALLDWMYASQKRTTPIKVGLVGSQQALLSVDLHDGIRGYIKQFPTKAVMSEVIWDAPQPTDLTAPMRRMVNADVDIIFVNTNAAAVVATKRALQALGKKIPVVTSSHNSLPTVGRAMGGMELVEGDFEVYGLSVPTEDAAGEARKFFDLLVSKYKLAAPWGVLTVQGMSQGIVTVRSIEAAIKKFGANNLDGTKLKEAMLSEKITGNKSIIPDFSFTKQTTFPSAGATVNIGTVKGGKYTTAATDVPMPNLARW
jgi:branched-chain amino acid transport system substrate-binding protein